MFLALITLTLCLAQWTAGQDCPKEYQRLSREHSFCKPPNPNCQMKQRGIKHQQKAMDDILNTHNRLRNLLALGKAVNASLPSASNMMQMTWDHELAKIAQKHADQCIYKHDCNPCRAVENFKVGQNIWKSWIGCPDGKCQGKDADWKGAIESFYNEVKDFNNGNIDKFGSATDRGTTGHFTQLVWAKSWRIGCGFVAYVEGGQLISLLVCNYGPGGNINSAPIYKPGPACSNCPTNSNCGKRGAEYPGLCNMKGNVAPEYPPNPEALLYCDFRSQTGDCSLSLQGQGASIKSTLGGNFFSVQVKDGQQAVVHFKTLLKPSSSFCLQITYRTYTDEIGGRDVSKLDVDIIPQNGGTMSLTVGRQKDYIPMGINLPKVDDATFSLKFSVPAGAMDHILDIKEIEATNGNC